MTQHRNTSRLSSINLLIIITRLIDNSNSDRLSSSSPCPYYLLVFDLFDYCTTLNSSKTSRKHEKIALINRVVRRIFWTSSHVSRTLQSVHGLAYQIVNYRIVHLNPTDASRYYQRRVTAIRA